MQIAIDEFLNRIFPNNDVKDWVLKILAEMLEPTNHRNNMIYIWVGVGSNGKSSLLKLLEDACGNYIARVDKGILVSGGYFKKDYYEQAANRQMLVLEDGSDCQIRLENVKKLLATDPKSGLPTCGDLHVICNSVPRFEFWDNSIVEERVRVIPFLETFMGGFMDAVHCMWGPYFWRRLVHIYTEGLKPGTVIEIPKAIIDAGEHYYPQKNSFECFIDEHLRIDELPQTTIMDDIIREYRAWMDGQPNPGRRLKKDEMYEALLSRFTLRIEGGVFKNLAIV